MTEPAAPVDLAVALVNTWDLVADPHELLPDDATAQRFLLRHGYPQDAAALESAEQLRTVRDRLRAVVHAAGRDPARGDLARADGRP